MLCDVNVLLALCYQGHANHLPALGWLNGISAARSLAVCRVSQLGLLRLLNNPAVMGEDVMTAASCWRVQDELLADYRFWFAEEPTGLSGALRELTRRLQFSPKVWQDAYLAAFARVGGLRIVTFDHALARLSGSNVILLKA